MNRGWCTPRGINRRDFTAWNMVPAIKNEIVNYQVPRGNRIMKTTGEKIL
jgi:hypothetical protein